MLTATVAQNSFKITMISFITIISGTVYCPTNVFMMNEVSWPRVSFLYSELEHNDCQLSNVTEGSEVLSRLMC